MLWTRAACCEPPFAADDPVLFLEHKKLYREPYNRSPHPGPDYTIPFGKAKVVKSGQSLTVITYGAVVQKSLQAALQLEQRYPDKTVEVIDLRSLVALRLGGHPNIGRKNQPRDGGARGLPVLGLWRGVGGADRERIVRASGCAGGRVGALDTWVGYNPRSRTRFCRRWRIWRRRWSGFSVSSFWFLVPRDN